MKKERISRSFSVIVLTLLTVLLLLPETYATNSNRFTQKKSINQNQQTPKALYRQINKKTPGPSSFKRDMPFGEAIDILRNSTIPPLNIAVLWNDLDENAGINRETPIGMDGLSEIPLRTHLKVLLMSVSAGGLEKIGYVVNDGVIIIATQSALPRKRLTRIYDVSDLVSESANYRIPGFGIPFGFDRMPYAGMMQGGAGYGRQGFLDSGSGRAYIGAGSVQTSSNSGYYASGNLGAYRSRELVNLIEKLYGSNR
ncbi:MAG: hypothetical protein JW837_00405 [Sedimentisphaerales bacterium]|nr:hypothetical protein [Sedimentisphaerales bacterium]